MPRAAALVLTVLAGTALGLAYGRFVSPVQYVDTDPSSLRSDYRTDYVLMVAERAAVDHDASKALRRLALLGPQAPDRLVAEAIQFAQAAFYAPDDVGLLQDLLRLVQQEMPSSTPESGAP